MVISMSDQEGPRRSLKGKTEDFLEVLFQKGEVLVRELIVENDRLRAQLESEGVVKTPTPQAAGRENIVDRLMQRVAVLEHECDEIRRLAGNVEAESGGYRSRLEVLEQEHYHLACMYVAGLQFHTAATVDEVLRTVTEILLNFVGVGKFTIYGVDEERRMLFPIMREGGDPAELDELPVMEGVLKELAGLGRSWKAGDPNFVTSDELMCLPLFGGTRLVGVARLESFLSQKTDFEDRDSSLLSLVSEHGGIGMETAWMRAHAKDVPLQREAVEQLVGS
jgi:hypothetical protein